MLQKGRGVLAQSLVPPGIAGYDADWKLGAQVYDPAAARALLDRFGYKDRDGDGFRETPDGKPLVLDRWSVPTSAQRDADELWTKNLAAIGLKLAIHKDKLPGAAQDGAQRQDPVRERTAGTPTTRTPRTSCSSCTAPTPDRRTSRGSGSPTYDRLYDRGAQAARLRPSARRSSAGCRR